MSKNEGPGEQSQRLRERQDRAFEVGNGLLVMLVAAGTIFGAVLVTYQVFAFAHKLSIALPWPLGVAAWIWSLLLFVIGNAVLRRFHEYEDLIKRAEEIEQLARELAAENPGLLKAQRLESLVQTQEGKESKYRRFWSGAANNFLWAVVGALLGFAISYFTTAHH